MSILIKDTTLIPMTKTDLVMENVDILIKNKMIYRISKERVCEECEVIDGRDKLVTPGFINTHTHLGMSLLRNYADDLDLQTWLNTKIFPIEDLLTPDDIYYASKYSMVEMIKSGTTSFVDMYFELDRVGDAALELGMRGVLTPGYVGDDRSEERIESIRKLYKNYHNREGLLKVGLGPHAIYTVPANHIKKIVDLSKQLDVLIHIHVSETQEEFDNCMEEHGMTPVKYLDSLGVFDRPCIAAHCVYLTDEDIEILARKKVHVAHNPSSNMKLASGFARTRDMGEAGVNLCLGTDGASSNNNLNIIEEIHLASLIAKGSTLDPKAMSAYETLKMATIGGASAIGMERLVGEIREGMLADLCIFDINKIHLKPHNNLISSLVYSAQGSDVESVIINGEFVMKNRKVLGVDEEELKKEVESRIGRLISEL